MDHIVQGNRFAQVLHNFEQKIRETDFDKAIFLQVILDTLPHIKLKDGYTLGCYSVGDGIDSIMYFYPLRKDAVEEYGPDASKIDKRGKRFWQKLFGLRKDDDLYNEDWDSDKPFQDGQIIRGTLPFGCRVPELKKYLDIDFTPDTIWESLLLLEESENYLKHGWHGCYRNGKIVVDNQSVIDVFTNLNTGISSTKIEEADWKPFLDNERILPIVNLKSDTEAIVHYCHWSDWSGLDRFTVRAYKDGRSIRFERDNPVNLVEYDCGYVF